MLVDQGDKQTKLLGTVYHNRISQCNILVDSIDKLISSGGDGHALSGQVSTLSADLENVKSDMSNVKSDMSSMKGTMETIQDQSSKILQCLELFRARPQD